MLPERGNNKLYLFVYGFLLIFVAFIAVYLTLNSNLGARDSSADNSEDSFSYISSDNTFSANGSIDGIKQYVSSSSSQAYSTSAFKALTNFKFAVSNAPLGSVLRFCLASYQVEAKVGQNLLCENINLNSSSEADWAANLPVGLLLESGKDYYCTAQLAIFPVISATDAAVSGAKFNCEFTAVSTSEVSDVALSFDSGLLAELRQGPDLLASGLSLTAKSELNIIGLYASLAADPGFSEQSFAEICVKTSSINNCLPDYFYSNSGDSRYTAGYSATSLTVKPNDSLKFSCRTQAGRWGGCNLFVFIRVAKSVLSDATTLQRSDYYAIPAGFSASYCADSSFYYQNSALLAAVSPDKIVQRCEAILSAGSY